MSYFDDFMKVAGPVLEGMANNAAARANRRDTSRMSSEQREAYYRNLERMNNKINEYNERKIEREEARAEREQERQEKYDLQTEKELEKIAALCDELQIDQNMLKEAEIHRILNSEEVEKYPWGELEKMQVEVCDSDYLNYLFENVSRMSCKQAVEITLPNDSNFESLFEKIKEDVGCPSLNLNIKDLVMITKTEYNQLAFFKHGLARKNFNWSFYPYDSFEDFRFEKGLFCDDVRSYGTEYNKGKIMENRVCYFESPYDITFLDEFLNELKALSKSKVFKLEELKRMWRKAIDEMKTKKRAAELNKSIENLSQKLESSGANQASIVRRNIPVSRGSARQGSRGRKGW